MTGVLLISAWLLHGAVAVTTARAAEPPDAIDLDGDDAEPADAELPDDVDDGPAVPPPAPAPVPPPSLPEAAEPGREAVPDTGGAAVPSEEAIARESTAELDKPGRRGRFKPDGSPQRFALEFKIGPYLPNVDRRYDGPGLGPYSTIFGPTDDLGAATGEAKVGVMPAFGFDWQFVYLGGPFGIGTQIAFFRDKARALIAEPNPGENVRSEADSTRFAMVPISLLASYRFELLADKFRWVPLVPYAKAGLTYAFWWTRDGSGDISENAAGQKGRGGVLGWQLNAGGMLRLDFIEPGTAKKLDRTTGINHTYVFGELQVSRLANFGAGNSIALGDTTWFVGLAMEF